MWRQYRNWLMVDIETLAIDNRAAIIAIGACEFGPKGPGSIFKVNINEETNEDAGRIIDPETVRWWREVPTDEARRLTFCDRVPLKQGLQEFAKWVGKYPEYCLYCHGPQFDEVILRTAYKDLGMQEPWGYRAPRDTRTLLDVGYALQCVYEPKVPYGPAHVAWVDACHQAYVAAGIINHLETVR